MKSSMDLSSQKLTDEDMDIITTKAIIEKSCLEINLKGVLLHQPVFQSSFVVWKRVEH